MAHLAPESQTTFDFRKYITRSLEEDFKVVVGISPIIWFFAVLFLLSNTYGWYSYLWLPFLPLIIILMVGAKLQVIITKMGLRIQERGDVVKGTPVVRPGDDLFWFGRPRLILYLIHIVLFQNAFQLAFFVWSLYEFGKRNCFHKRIEDIAVRISMGVIVQVLCSYVTLPLYALVTQMGSNMRPTIFNDRVAAALKNWHRTAKKNTKHSHHSHDQQANSPLSSRPATPSHGMSPVHLLRNHRHSSLQSLHASPRKSNLENNIAYDCDLELEEYLPSSNNPSTGADHHDSEGIRPIQEPSSSQLPPVVLPGALLSQHEINMTNLLDFRKE
ncbi:hypothetical protein I3760_01G271900 [Carya illinoinensis]|nr:hypothetical protein I3760_01G271900 [Carya illinoinensis]